MPCGSRVRFFFVWKRLAMNRNQKHCQRQVHRNAFCIQSIQTVEFHDIAISAGSSPRRFRREGEVWGVLASFHVLGQAAWPIMLTFHLGHSSNGRTCSQTCSWLIAEAHQEDARSERCPSRKRTQSGSILGASYFPATWHTVAEAGCVKGNLSWTGWILTHVSFQVVHIMMHYVHISYLSFSICPPCLEYSLRTIRTVRQ